MSRFFALLVAVLPLTAIQVHAQQVLDFGAVIALAEDVETDKTAFVDHLRRVLPGLEIGPEYMLKDEDAKDHPGDWVVSPGEANLSLDKPSARASCLRLGPQSFPETLVQVRAGLSAEPLGRDLSSQTFLLEALFWAIPGVREQDIPDGAQALLACDIVTHLPTPNDFSDPEALRTAVQALGLRTDVSVETKQGPTDTRIILNLFDLPPSNSRQVLMVAVMSDPLGDGARTWLRLSFVSVLLRGLS